MYYMYVCMHLSIYTFIKQEGIKNCYLAVILKKYHVFY